MDVPSSDRSAAPVMSSLPPAPAARSRILGTGRYVPERVVDNAELEQVVDTSDAWIVERTGIKRRRRAAEEQAASDLAAEAAREALAAAGLNVADLDLIVVATISGDQPMPACATFLQQKLGAEEIPVFDLSAACAGFLYGMSIADAFIANGTARIVLVVGVELLSRILNWDDRTTCVLFGDGSGACVLGPSDFRVPAGSAEPPRGILSSRLYTDGALAGALHIPGGGTAEPHTTQTLRDHRDKVFMTGREVFKSAVRNLTQASAQVLKDAGLTSRDLDWVVPHQANLRIINQVTERLGFPAERVVLNISEYGNTSSASIPIALDEAIRDGRIQPGQIVLVCALGSGIAWGAMLLRV